MGRVGPLHHPTYLSRIKKEWGTRVSLVPMEWQRRRLRGGCVAMAAIEARHGAKCGCHDRRRGLGTASGARARAVEQCVECGNDRRMAPRLRTDARLRVVEARARGCGIGPSDVATWYGRVVGLPADARLRPLVRRGTNKGEHGGGGSAVSYGGSASCGCSVVWRDGAWSVLSWLRQSSPFFFLV